MPRFLVRMVLALAALPLLAGSALGDEIVGLIKAIDPARNVIELETPTQSAMEGQFVVRSFQLHPDLLRGLEIGQRARLSYYEDTEITVTRVEILQDAQ